MNVAPGKFFCGGSEYSLNNSLKPRNSANALKEGDAVSNSFTAMSTEVPDDMSSRSNWDSFSSPSLSVRRDSWSFCGSRASSVGRSPIPISCPKVHRTLSSAGSSPDLSTLRDPSQFMYSKTGSSSSSGKVSLPASPRAANTNMPFYPDHRQPRLCPEFELHECNTYSKMLESPHVGFNKPWAEERCREAAKALETNTRRAAMRLGAADPAVEEVHDRIRELRNRADSLRWSALVDRHQLDVRNSCRALEAGADPAVLEDALRRAACSELGPGHEIVRSGKQFLKKYRIKQSVERQSTRSLAKVNHINEAIETGDISAISQAISEASNVNIKHIPEVHAARETLRRMRQGIECNRRLTLEEDHYALMLQACATKDPRLINERIWYTAHSELGFGHPIVNFGKGCIRTLRLQGKRAEHDALREECMSALMASQD